MVYLNQTINRDSRGRPFQSQIYHTPQPTSSKYAMRGHIGSQVPVILSNSRDLLPSNSNFSGIVNRPSFEQDRRRHAIWKKLSMVIYYIMSKKHKALAIITKAEMKANIESVIESDASLGVCVSGRKEPTPTQLKKKSIIKKK